MKLCKRNLALAAGLTFSLGPLMAGCAHSRPHPEPVPEATSAPSPDVISPSALAPALLMPLPYTFSRRGVEIRVNYVEFVSGQPQVNVSLHETRNQDAEILASTLMQARDDSGRALAYSGYLREGRVESSPNITFKPNDRFLITLTFEPPAVSTTSAHSTILVFPTGKWWHSNPPE